MKKIAWLLLLAVIAGFASGCGTTAGSGGGTATLPASVAASSVGMLAATTAKPADSTSFIGISSGGIKASSVTTPTFGAGGWISYAASGSYTGGSYSYNINILMYGKSTGLIDTAAKLLLLSTGVDTLDATWNYSTVSISLTTPEAISYTITMGNSKADPLKLTGMHSASTILNGAVSNSITYLGQTYNTTLNYSSLTVSGSTGYPTGSVSFTVAQSGTTAYSGTITFNGTTTATIVFTGGATYTVNLVTGAVTAV